MATLNPNARVTVGEVKEVTETALDDSEIKLHINLANNMVDENLQPKLSDPTLTDVELLLSAHFVALKDPQIESEGVGDASFDYMGDSGLGLDMTRHGQMAKSIDSSGTLNNLDSSTKQADVNVLSEADV